jgi:tetratricopeptide (TPR) repeat protein
MAISLAFYMILRKFGWLTDLFKAPGTSGAFLNKGASSYSAVKTIINSTAYYYEKLLCPWNLNIIPDIPSGWEYSLLFVLPFILLFFLIIKRNFFAAFWLLWLGFTLLPSLSIAISQIAAPIGERYMYLPSAGLCFLLVMLLYPAVETPAPSGCNRCFTGQLKLALLVVICLTYALLTYNRLSDWRSDFALWQDAAGKNPRSVITKTNYGIALLRERNFNEAERQFSAALNLKQLSHEKKSIVLNSLSIIAIERKDYHKAETLLFESINENPRNVGSYNNLGYLYMKLGSVTDDFATKEPLILKAIEVFNESLKFASEVKEINFNLGLCYLELNDFQRSKAHFDAVIQKDPNSDLGVKSIKFTVYLEMKKKQFESGISPLIK